MKYLKMFILAIVLSLGMYEIYFQITNYKARKAQGNNVTSSTYVNKGYYWTYPEQGEFQFNNEDGEVIKIQSDRLGFRNKEVKTNYDVLLIGDSFTSAANTPDEKTLANLLRKSGLTTYNAGIDGIGTIHEYYIIRDMLEQIKPKMVVLNFYLGNDFRDNYFSADIDPNAKRMPTTEPEKASVEPAKNTVPWNLRIKAILANSINHIGLLKLVYQKIYIPKKYEETAMSYYGRSEINLMCYDHQNPCPQLKQSIERTDKAFGLIKQLLDQKGIPFIVVGIPSKAQVIKSVKEVDTYALDPGLVGFFLSVRDRLDFNRPNQILETLCGMHQIQYISLLKPFRAKRDEKIYYHFDAHWTWIGQKVAADTIIPKLKEVLKK